MDLGSMEAFKQMDIYSMALVLWEIISRCEVAGKYSALSLDSKKVNNSRISLGRLMMRLRRIMHLTFTAPRQIRHTKTRTLTKKLL